MVNKSKIIKIIEKKIFRTKNKKDKEKLKELEEAVKNNRKEKIKEILKELPSDIAKGLSELLINLIGGAGTFF